MLRRTGIGTSHCQVAGLRRVDRATDGDAAGLERPATRTRSSRRSRRDSPALTASAVSRGWGRALAVVARRRAGRRAGPGRAADDIERSPRGRGDPGVCPRATQRRAGGQRRALRWRTAACSAGLGQVGRSRQLPRAQPRAIRRPGRCPSPSWTLPDSTPSGLDGFPHEAPRTPRDAGTRSSPR